MFEDAPKTRFPMLAEHNENQQIYRKTIHLRRHAHRTYEY